MTRLVPAPNRALGLLLIPLFLSGCLRYFYPTDPIPELLLYESFQSLDFERTWSSGSDPNDTQFAEILNGRLAVYKPGYFLETKNTYPVDITILLEWSVTNGDVMNQLYPAENSTRPDFSLSIPELDLDVELHLYHSIPGLPVTDYVRIRNFQDEDIVDPVSVVSPLPAGITRGTLEVRLTVFGDTIHVEVEVPENSLVASADIVAEGVKESTVTVGASGVPDNPRSLEELYFFRRPVLLGGLP